MVLNNSYLDVDGSLCGSSLLTITSSGGGTVTLTSGSSTFSGGMYVSGSGTVLSVGTSSVMCGSTVMSGPVGTGSVSLDNGTELATPSSVGAISLGNNLAIGTNVTLAPGAGSSLVLSGVISDIETAGSLIIAGPVTLTGANTYSETGRRSATAPCWTSAAARPRALSMAT